MKMYLRIIYYFIGVFLLALSIGLSLKANLGITPVSSVPYTLTVVWAVEIGIATVIFHIVLVLIQLAILRKKFGWRNILQLPIGVIFGYFTSLSFYLVTFLPNSTNIWMSLAYLVLSIIVIAIGEIFYLVPDLIPIASSGVVQVVAATLKKPFSHVKICFDVIMVGGSAIVCLATIGSLGSVGIGTVICAVFVGTTIKIIIKLFYKLTGIQLNLKSAYESDVDN